VIRALGILLICAAAPVTAQDWSGQWTGVSLGYGSGTYQQGVSALNELGAEVDVKGAMFGLSYAWNRQSGPTVYGFDAALISGIDGITAQGTLGPQWNCASGDCNVSIDTLLTLRGRFGWLASPEMLVYAAGGMAAGRVTGGILDSTQQGESTAIGYTLGVGIEQMIADGVTMFGEANYVDLGTLTFGTNDLTEDYDGIGDFSTVKLGLNFKF